VACCVVLLHRTPNSTYRVGSRQPSRAIPHPSAVLLRSLPELPTMLTAYRRSPFYLSILELALLVVVRSY